MNGADRHDAADQFIFRPRNKVPIRLDLGILGKILKQKFHSRKNHDHHQIAGQDRSIIPTPPDYPFGVYLCRFIACERYAAAGHEGGSSMTRDATMPRWGRQQPRDLNRSVPALFPADCVDAWPPTFDFVARHAPATRFLSINHARNRAKALHNPNAPYITPMARITAWSPAPRRCVPQKACRKTLPIPGGGGCRYS